LRFRRASFSEAYALFFIFSDIDFHLLIIDDYAAAMPLIATALFIDAAISLSLPPFHFPADCAMRRWLMPFHEMFSP
jgi:hypothetical protein